MTEESPGGSRIYRHQEREREFEVADADEALLAVVEEHVEQHIGPVESVFHELISDLVHVDVLQVAPRDERPWWTLVTCGMAARPMSDSSFAELVMCLPPAWPLDEQQWPLPLLQFLARLPHEYETHFAHGHTVPNGDPPEPLAPGTGLCGVIFAPPLLTDDAFATVERAEGDIRILGVIALHADEMEYKLRRGSDALHELLDAAEVSELLDVGRPSVAPRRAGLRGALGRRRSRRR